MCWDTEACETRGRNGSFREYSTKWKANLDTGANHSCTKYHMADIAEDMWRIWQHSHPQGVAVIVKLERYWEVLNHRFDVSFTGYCIGIRTNCRQYTRFYRQILLKRNHLSRGFWQKWTENHSGCLMCCGRMKPTLHSMRTSIRTTLRFARHWIPVSIRRRHCNLPMWQFGVISPSLSLSFLSLKSVAQYLAWKRTQWQVIGTSLFCANKPFPHCSQELCCLQWPSLRMGPYTTWLIQWRHPFESLREDRVIVIDK